MLQDSFGRRITDLRISVTDRCNFRCFYCKTSHGTNGLPRNRLLSYEEITRVARIVVAMGVHKIRITGGEPLLRKHLDRLVEQVATLEGVRDVALTTNGFNFFEHAERLRDAGLRRVTISLDSLRRERFREMTGRDELPNVLRSIEVARRLGFHPVKVNCVVVRGVNDDELEEFVRFSGDTGVAVRFIEFMPLDEEERWTRDRVVSGREIVERLRRSFTLEALDPESPTSTSRDYRVDGGAGRIGLITTVTNPFCDTCSRLRLTADGCLRTCLFAREEFDLRPLLRSGAGDEEVAAFIRRIVAGKPKGHGINEPDFVPPPRSMSFIGG
ncbi:MAG: GTP 3',8-cyclase MoaA [Acidobacteriota bacterium]